MVIGDSGFDENTSTTNFEEGWSTKSIKKMNFWKTKHLFLFWALHL